MKKEMKLLFLLYLFSIIKLVASGPIIPDSSNPLIIDWGNQNQLETIINNNSTLIKIH